MDEKRQKSILDGDDRETPSIYTNSVSLSLSVFDIKMVFGEVIEATEEHILTKPLVKVYMSPQHAKVLLGVLHSNVALYEREFGEISLPSLPISSNEPSR